MIDINVIDRYLEYLGFRWAFWWVAGGVGGDIDGDMMDSKLVFVWCWNNEIIGMKINMQNMIGLKVDLDNLGDNSR